MTIKSENTHFGGKFHGFSSGFDGASHVHAGGVALIGANRISGPGIVPMAPHGFDFAAAADPPWAHGGHGILGIPGEFGCANP